METRLKFIFEQIASVARTVANFFFEQIAWAIWTDNNFFKRISQAKGQIAKAVLASPADMKEHVTHA